MKVSGRLESFCDANNFCDVLILRQEDIRWLTGFTGGSSQLVVKREQRCGVLIVDGRYVERAKREVEQSGALVEVVCSDRSLSPVQIISSIVDKTLSTNPLHISSQYARELSGIFDIQDEGATLDELRRVKNSYEIDLMQRAAGIADLALMSVVADGLFGKTEKQVRNRLEFLMQEGGADRQGFSTIVATGLNGASPHHEPTDALIESGHGVVIDMGAELEGYRSDMTRTVLVGDVPDQYREMFELVREAQLCGVATVRDGAPGRDVDSAVRSVFAAAGVEDEFIHGTGHGIGLFIHEIPILSPSCTAVLQTNEVVTVEPGLYRGGVGGVRIEDLVVVTDSSCRILTLSPKELSCPQSPRMI